MVIAAAAVEKGALTLSVLSRWCCRSGSEWSSKTGAGVTALLLLWEEKDEEGCVRRWSCCPVVSDSDFFKGGRGRS